MAKKIIISKHFLSSFNLSRDSEAVEYVVEAKQGNSFVRVGGPFTEITKAKKFATDYSKAHADVEVQVVILQP